MKQRYSSSKFKFAIILLFSIIISPVFGQHQNALDFDGIDDQVYTTTASNFINGANQISMSCWVYPTNPNPVFPDFDGFCGFRNDVDLDFYLVQIGADRVEARFRNGFGTAVDIVYNGIMLNNWNHFVFTYDGAFTRLYFNGLLVDSMAASGTVNNINEDFFIGNIPYFATEYLLIGKMDEVALWDRAISSAEVSCIYSGGVNPASANLQLYYSMNEGMTGGNNTSINSLLDFSPNLAHATISGMSLIGTTSNFISGTTNYSVTPMVICPGTAYAFGTQTLTSSGYYMEGFSTAGCDSIAELILTVESLSTTVSVSNETLTADQSGATYQWLDCDNASAAISGETGQSFMPTVNGNYAVIISSGSCLDTSICVMMNSVGIDQLNSVAQAVYYPNPFESSLIIGLEEFPDPVSIIVTGISGEVVYSKVLSGIVEHAINTEAWAQGVYVFKVGSDKGFHVESVVKR